MIAYLDTSAAMKLLIEEPESIALAEELTAMRARADVLVSSLLLHSELHCAANRRPEVLPATNVTSVLEAVALVDVERADLTTAAVLPGRLRSADAIHLAAALRIGVDALVAYDAELSAAAAAAGLRVVAPRRSRARPRRTPRQ